MAYFVSCNCLLQNPHCHVLNGGYQCLTINMFDGKMALDTKPAFFTTNLTEAKITHMVQKFPLFEVVQASHSLLIPTSKIDWWKKSPRVDRNSASRRTKSQKNGSGGRTVVCASRVFKCLACFQMPRTSASHASPASLAFTLCTPFGSHWLAVMYCLVFCVGSCVPVQRTEPENYFLKLEQRLTDDPLRSQLVSWVFLLNLLLVDHWHMKRRPANRLPEVFCKTSLTNFFSS